MSKPQPSDGTSSPAAGETTAGAHPAEDPQTKAHVTFDDSGVDALYANVCRVSSTPEEVILDLGLDTNPFSAVDRRVPVSHRVILNHYTAKRLAALLLSTVHHHEKVFGPLETDFRKRVQS